MRVDQKASVDSGAPGRMVIVCINKADSTT